MKKTDYLEVGDTVTRLFPNHLIYDRNRESFKTTKRGLANYKVVSIESGVVKLSGQFSDFIVSVGAISDFKKSEIVLPKIGEYWRRKGQTSVFKRIEDIAYKSLSFIERSEKNNYIYSIDEKGYIVWSDKKYEDFEIVPDVTKR